MGNTKNQVNIVINEEGPRSLPDNEHIMKPLKSDKTTEVVIVTNLNLSGTVLIFGL